MDLETNFRNAGGVPIKKGYTQYSDLRMSSTNRDVYMGSSNNEVFALTCSNAGGVLLLPINDGTPSHRILPADQPSNLIQGRAVVAVDFNPFDTTMFVGLAEDKSNSPPSVLIFGGRYNPDLINDVPKLNSEVELLFSYEMCHAKRPVEIKFSRFVKDLLYSAGNTEISAYKLLNGQEVELEPLGQYTYDNNSFITDFDISDDGKYLGATYTVNSSKGTESILAIYGADFDTLMDGNGEESILPITSVSAGMVQRTKIAMLKNGEIVLGKLAAGRRHLGIVQFDEARGTLTHVGSEVDIAGTSAVQLMHTNWENIIFAYGRGDLKVEMLIVENEQIINIGTFKSPTSILGLFYFDQSYICPQHYELIRFMIAKGSNTSARLEMQAFTLPRSGSFESSTIYQPMLYNEPSMLFEDYEKSKPLTLKTIHPVAEFDKLMAINKLGESKEGTRKSSMKPSMKFSKTFAKTSQNRVTASPEKSSPTATQSAQTKPAPAALNVVQKEQTPTVSKPTQTKPDVKSEDKNNNSADMNAAVGQPLAVAPNAVRKVAVTHKDLMNVLAELDKANKRIDSLENTVNGLREQIALANQVNDLDISDSME